MNKLNFDCQHCIIRSDVWFDSMLASLISDDNYLFVTAAQLLKKAWNSVKESYKIIISNLLSRSAPNFDSLAFWCRWREENCIQPYFLHVHHSCAYLIPAAPRASDGMENTLIIQNVSRLILSQLHEDPSC